LREFFLRASIDGKPIERWHSRVSSRVLEVEPFTIPEIHQVFEKEISIAKGSREQKFLIERKRLFKKPVTVYIFCTPVKKYIDIEAEIEMYELRKEVDMGEFSSLCVEPTQDRIKVTLEKDCLYDVFGFSGSVFAGGGRISTSQGKVPFAITFEEMKLFALRNLGVTLKEAKGVKAKVISMNAWGLKGRLIIAGFCLDPEKEESISDHTIMVNHCCGVSYSHGYSKEDFLTFFKK